MRKNLVKIIAYLLIIFWAPFIITLCMNGVKGKEPKAVSEGSGSSHNTSVPDYSSVAEFVTGTVAAYYTAGDSSEFLKSIAIIAGTYAKYIEVNGAESIPADFALDYLTNEEMRERWQDKYEENIKIINDVVAEVGKTYISYKEKPILPYVHSISAGYTRAGNCEYLQAVDCRDDCDEKGYLTKLKIAESEVGSIQIIKRDESGYITELILDGKSISGDELAVGIALPSSNFSISREGGDCVFNVKGDGSGYGMSIASARKKAENGVKCQDILNYFYKNISIVSE